MKRRRKWTRYLTPGLVFQSVLIGGGYGTGAEIARYFGCHGLMGGLLALGAAASPSSLSGSFGPMITAP